MAADLPASLNERVTCSISAAIQYGIPANVMLAVAERENGRPGLARRNSNGTDDLGAMQLNTAYIASLRRYGITPADALAPGCYSYNLAAWRIRGHIAHDKGDLWTRAANYHSYTPSHNAGYRLYLIEAGARWSKWLSAHYRVTPSDTAIAAASDNQATRQRRSPLAITSGFGWRWHPITGGWKAHAGIDLAARSGTPVVAASDGIVSRAGVASGYGNLIAIEHGSGEETRYGHLSRIDVRPGQVVRAGQVIGAVGATGMATGPHLHYEMRVNGTPIDPSPYMLAQAQVRPKQTNRPQYLAAASKRPDSFAMSGYVERTITARDP